VKRPQSGLKSWGRDRGNAKRGGERDKELDKKRKRVECDEWDWEKQKRKEQTKYSNRECN